MQSPFAPGAGNDLGRPVKARAYLRVSLLVSLMLTIAATMWAAWTAANCPSTMAALEMLRGAGSTWGEGLSATSQHKNMALSPSSLRSLRGPGTSGMLGSVCKMHSECCAGHNETCDFFCDQGHEISEKSAAGWFVRGKCARKWQGYCEEDEECTVAGEICDRREGARAGVCKMDAVCHEVDCGHGSCRNGRCTCDWGFAGDRCERSTDAFAFLLYGDSPVNIVSARVLIRSLRALGSNHDVVAIVPQGYASVTPKHFLHILEQDGVKVRYTTDIKMPPSMDSDPIIHQRWSGVMNKFAAWELTEYSRVAMMDLDMVFELHGDDPAKLFEECTSEFCAVRDGDPRFINAGVMVVTPSEKRLAHIVSVLQEEQHHYDMPEQSFITKYCEKASNQMKLTELDRKWNSCVGGGMLFNIGWASSGYNVLHACSWGAKPPNVRMCFEGECDRSAERHMVLAWQHHHSKVDTCILHRQEGKCSADAGCAWCGNYCSDRRVPCSAKLFSTTVEVEVDGIGNTTVTNGTQPSAQAEEANASCGDFTGLTEFWDNAPDGWWAWPQGALYQILIDRFASPVEEPCANLSIHCGGTVAAATQKLGYLDQLGVDGVLVSPIVDNMPGGYHGYWPKDLYSVNARFGTEEDVKELVYSAHGLRMKVVADVNLNHAGGPGVEVPELIPRLKPFNKPEQFHSPNCSLFSPEDFEQSQRVLERCQLFGLPDYNHENTEVRRGLTRWLRSHVDTFGFDAVRIDAARHMPKSFVQHVRSTGAPIPAFHEIISPDLKMISGYSPGDFDSLYNYPLYFLLRETFNNREDRKPVTELVNELQRNRQDRDGRLTLNFLDNNDMPRFTRFAGSNVLFRNALLYILGTEGVPVILYGSEQDARGPGNTSDPVTMEAPDLWRPTLWEEGYSTTGATFRLIRRATWLRKRFTGLHRFVQHTVHSDHEVLVFARGPLMFSVTNMDGARRSQSQRILWHNASRECGPVRMCNVLAENVMATCVVMERGRPMVLDLAEAEPQLLAPESIAQEMLQTLGDDEATRRKLNQQQQQPQQQQQQQDAASQEVRVLQKQNWRDLPTGVSVSIEAYARMPHAELPVGITLNEPEAWAAEADYPVPLHMKQWSPPVGVAPLHSQRVVAKEACFHTGVGGPGVVYTRTPSQINVLCAHEGSFCGEAGAMLRHLEEPVRMDVPVLHLAYGALFQGGYYHLLIQILPHILPHLNALRAGKMRLFLEYDLPILLPLLARLGVERSVVHMPEGSSTPVQESTLGSWGFCAPEVVLYTHSGFANHHPSVQMLSSLRQELNLPEGGRRKNVLVLSRGNSTRTIRNEGELLSKLQTLGRPVELVEPAQLSLQQLADALAQAEVVVGAHGANLANIIFAQQATKVLEIVPQAEFRMENHHYWTLAGALGFQYLPVAQKVTSFNAELATNSLKRAQAIESFTVDVDPVVEGVRTLLTGDARV